MESKDRKNGNGARFSDINGVLGTAGFVVRLGDSQGNPDPVLGRQLQEHAIPGLMPEAKISPYLEPGKNVLPRHGELDLAAFKRVLALMAEVGAIPAPTPPAEKFVDLQYLKAAGIE